MHLSHNLKEEGLGDELILRHGIYLHLTCITTFIIYFSKTEREKPKNFHFLILAEV